MDPVTLVVGALAAGAAAGAGETASEAVKDAYAALKAAVRARFAGRPGAEDALQAYPEDPEAYQGAVAEHLRETGVDRDPRIVELAQELLRLMDADGTAAGTYTVDLRGAQGVQVGDHNTQTNTWN